MTRRQCMGGFCAIRERCDFHPPSEGGKVIERMCFPGDDGHYVEESPNSRPMIMMIPTHDQELRDRLIAEMAPVFNDERTRRSVDWWRAWNGNA